MVYIISLFPVVGGGAFDAPFFHFIAVYLRAVVGASPYIAYCGLHKTIQFIQPVLFLVEGIHCPLRVTKPRQKIGAV